MPLRTSASARCRPDPPERARMSGILLLEQLLNSLQFGLMLFLLAAGLTPVFGIMDLINLAHGSLYMIGAYLVAPIAAASGPFWIGLAGGVAASAVLGAVLECTVVRRLYQRDHLSQVLGTFALLLMANEGVRMIWGSQPLMMPMPAGLSGPVELLPGFSYPAYRLLIIGAGLAVALLLYVLVTRTRLGMQVRAGASNREMAQAMGADVRRLFTRLFAFGAALCAVAGGMLGPLLAVQVSMGESILILAFVVIVIGGIGSIRGALVGALLVGLVDTAGRTVVPMLFELLMGPAAADNAGPAVASILIYVLMAAVLFWKPRGLFPARGCGEDGAFSATRVAWAAGSCAARPQRRTAAGPVDPAAFCRPGAGRWLLHRRAPPHTDLRPGSHQPQP